ncbi:MAG: zinc-ribbon domain-containing protein, partial [Pseudomonadota bacterium]
MIIECEKCRSKFELDDGLLKEEGSKVKCSICQHMFKAYPPESPPAQELSADDLLDEDLQETVALDSPPVLEEETKTAVTEEPEEGAEFDRAFEDAMEDDGVEAVSLDEIPDEAEETVDLEEAMERASKIEEELTKEDSDLKASEKGEGDTEVSDALDKPKPKKKGGRSRLLPILLIIIIIVLAGGVAVFFLAPDLLPGPLSGLKSADKQAADTGVRRLAFAGVKGAFLDSKNSGQLFVIRGMVTNNYPKNRSFILLKGSIIDDKGAVAKTKLAYAGNTYP